LDAEDVVVGREHVHGSSIRRVHSNGNLSVIDARKVACPCWLMFFWFQGETVTVHTWVWGTSVVVVRLKLVEVLTLLLLEAILAVEDKLEGAQWASSFFGVIRGRGLRIKEWDTTRNADWDVAVGGRTAAWIVLENDFGVVVAGGEVPERRTGEGVGEAPDQFLDWVVVGQANLLGTRGGHGVGASVLNLLNEVFVTLLREAASFLGIEIHVVGPDLENVLVKVSFHIGRTVNIDTYFVVLKRYQRQIKTWIAVEEKDEWQVDSLTILGSSELGPVGLLGLVQVKLGVQTPPLLVVLVNALSTDREFDVVDRTLRNPVVVGGSVGSNSGVNIRFKFEVHVTDQITVTGDGHGHATGVGRGTVDSLFDVFHREVGVTLVHRLEEGNFWITSEIDILGAIGDELHEATSHCESFCTIYQEKNFG